MYHSHYSDHLLYRAYYCTYTHRVSTPGLMITMRTSTQEVPTGFIFGLDMMKYFLCLAATSLAQWMSSANNGGPMKDRTRRGRERQHTKLLFAPSPMQVYPKLPGIVISHTRVLLIVESVQCPTDSIVQLPVHTWHII